MGRGRGAGGNGWGLPISPRDTEAATRIEKNKEVWITLPGLHDIFTRKAKCSSVTCGDFSADSGTLSLLVMVPVQLQLLRTPHPISLRHLVH